MRKTHAKIVFALVIAGVMPFVTFACSGNDPLLGLRGPNPPGPDTGRDTMVTPQDGMTGEAGEGGETSSDASMDGPKDSMVQDTGIDTGVDTGVDARDD